MNEALRALGLAMVAILASASPALAFDLGDLLDAKDQIDARRLNVLADNVEIERGSPGAVTMLAGGAVHRRRPCLPGADCSRRPITAGNYLRIEGRAPWLVLMGYVGLVRTDARLHDKGDETSMNVIEVPAKSIRPGGLHIRAFGMGGVAQRLRGSG